MNKNLLTVAFFISSDEIAEGERDYKKTITNYRLSLGGKFNPPAVAYIKLPEDHKELLPDIVDFMYDNDVMPIAVSEGFEVKLFPEQEKCKDILGFFNQKELYMSMYTFFVIGGWKVAAEQVGQCVGNAISILESNDEILTVGFMTPNQTGQQVGNFMIDNFNFRPFIGRTRDIKLVAKFVSATANQFAGATAENAFGAVFNGFSYHPLKFLAYNPQVAAAV